MGNFRGFSSFLLISVLVLTQPLSWGSQAFAQQASKLQIRVLEGSNRILKKNDSLELVVEVRDGQAPLPGAEVTFIAPESGPGILFAGNLDRLTVKADDRGRATSGRTRSIGGEGAFSVGIVAMARGGTAATSTQAANQTPAPSTAGTPKKSNKLMWILIGAAGAGVVTAFALKGSDSDDADPEPTTPSITIGPPTVGAPE